MSRCSPYTPPNFKKEDVSLIGSIKKLQNGRGNTKQRKEPKSSKKRARDECNKLDSSEPKSKKRREEENKTNLNGSRVGPRKDQCEHLERSDLSEEHNQPAFVPNLCISMPSTPKSSKGNAALAPDANGKRPNMVLRLKLPLRKHNDPQPVSTCKVPSSSAQPATSSKIQAVIPKTCTVVQQPKLQFPASEEPCFSGRAPEAPTCIVEAEPSNPRHRRSHGHRIRKLERHLHKLILNWKPPPLQLNEPYEEDLDWLFASRRLPKDGESGAQITKAHIPEPSSCPVPTDSLQPRACYLPELDMYQLPYVIPF